jgi:hypothetical protein
VVGRSVGACFIRVGIFLFFFVLSFRNSKRQNKKMTAMPDDDRKNGLADVHDAFAAAVAAEDNRHVVLAGPRGAGIIRCGIDAAVEYLRRDENRWVCVLHTISHAATEICDAVENDRIVSVTSERFSLLRGDERLMLLYYEFSSSVPVRPLRLLDLTQFDKLVGLVLDQGQELDVAPQILVGDAAQTFFVSRKT